MNETVYIYLLKTNNYTVNVTLKVYDIKYIYKYTKEHHHYNFIFFLITSKFYKTFNLLNNTILILIDKLIL